MNEKVKLLFVMVVAVICVAVIFSPAFTAEQTKREALPAVQKMKVAPMEKSKMKRLLPDLIVSKFAVDKNSFRKVNNKTVGVKFNATLKNIGKAGLKKPFYFTVQRFDNKTGKWKNTALGSKNCFKITKPLASNSSLSLRKEVQLTHDEVPMAERSQKGLKLRPVVNAKCSRSTSSQGGLVAESNNSNNFGDPVFIDPGMMVSILETLGINPDPIQFHIPLPLKCQGHTVTIYGTNGNDANLQGTPNNDVIHGLGGNDTIYGNGGNDIICGGEGNDTIYCQGGNDIIYGQGGNDHLWGLQGNDKLYGGAGDDHLRGAIGQDELYGGTGNDTLSGEQSNDKLFGGEGDDRLYGQSGSDYIYGGEGNDIIYGHSGNDKLYGQSGDDVLEGDEGTDECDGGPGTDSNPSLDCETKTSIS